MRIRLAVSTTWPPAPAVGVTVMSDRGTVAIGPANDTSGLWARPLSDPVPPTGFIVVNAGATIGNPASARRSGVMSRVMVYGWPGVTVVGAPRVIVTFWVGSVPISAANPTPRQE